MTNKIIAFLHTIAYRILLIIPTIICDVEAHNRILCRSVKKNIELSVIQFNDIHTV